MIRITTIDDSTLRKFHFFALTYIIYFNVSLIEDLLCLLMRSIL